ncbi:MAG: hypothetical protein ACRD8Z_01305 [Nitrososphaeraceae archaeon]
MAILLLPTSTAFATILEGKDETQQEEECREENDYSFLCDGDSGVNGLPFCDKYNATERAEQFPNITGGSCYDRTTDPIAFCEEFDDLIRSYENCRQIPGTEEYIEYMATRGPDESCLFDISQIKCLPDPRTDECPPGFGDNEGGRCFPMANGEWKCPEVYHGTDDDESGQCYPNSEGCDVYTTINGERFDYVLLTDRSDGKSDRCAKPSYLCHEDPTREVCKSEVS